MNENKNITADIIGTAERRKKKNGETKYRDHKDRKLERGETQRKDGRYRYHYKGADGKWHDVYSWKLTPIDSPPAGKEDCLSLREKEAEINMRLDKGIKPRGNDYTVIEFIEFQLGSEGLRKNTTKKSDRSNMKFIRSSRLAGIRIDKVSEECLKGWLEELQESGKGYSSIYGYWKLLKKAFSLAEKKKWIPDNPTDFDFSDFVADDSNERVALTLEEKESFLEFIKNHKIYSRYYDEIYILFYTGLRISEFCGLTVNDIDFENSLIHLDHQLHKSDKGYYISSQKGKMKGRKKDIKTRSVPMMKGVDKAFERLIDRRPKLDRQIKVESEDTRIPAKTDFIILGQTQMPKYAKLYENYFKDICNAYNEAHPEHPLKVTPHICRHTFCTSLAMLDVNPVKLQKIMGHTDLKTTARYY